MLINLRPASPKDVEAIAGLMDELERFYGGEPAEPLDEQVEQIREALFGDAPDAHVLMAWDIGLPDTAAGFASFSYLWPAAGFTRSLYLKELYVAEAYRRVGVGKILMDELHEIARRNRCSRVEWTTDASNEDARRFYASLGYDEDASKIFYRSRL